MAPAVQTETAEILSHLCTAVDLDDVEFEGYDLVDETLLQLKVRKLF